MNDATDKPLQEDDIFDFPCDFPIKVMGKAVDGFESLVVNIIRKHVERLAEDAVKTRESKAGNYVSVTVVIEADSKQQLDNIYMDLTANKKVIMAL